MNPPLTIKVFAHMKLHGSVENRGGFPIDIPQTKLKNCLLLVDFK